MRKKFKTLLCAAAILGSMSATRVYALDIDTDTTQSSSVTYNEIVNVTENCSWTIENGTSPTIVEINDKLTNDGYIINNASLITKEINNINSISGSNSSLTITNGGENQGTISQDKIILSGGTLQNSNRINATSSISIDSNATLNNNTSSSIISSNITNNGVLNNNGMINSQNELVNSGTINGDNGTLNIKNGSNTNAISQGTIKIENDFSNSGELIAKTNFSNSGNLTGDTGKLTVNGGSNTGTIAQEAFTNNSGEFNNSSTMEVGNFENKGSFNNNTGATLDVDSLTNSGTLTNSANITATEIGNTGSFISSGDLGANDNKVDTVKNNGNFNNSGNAYVNNFVNGNNNQNATLINSGSFNSENITNDGNINNTTSDSAIGSIVANEITNNGNITNSGTISISDSLINNGTINNSNTITVADTGSLTNANQILNNGKISSEVLHNDANASITGNNGTLEFKQGQNEGTISQAVINHLGDSTFENFGEVTANEFNVGENGTFSNNGSDSKLTIGTGTNNGKIDGGIINIKGDYTNNGIIRINNNTNFTIKEGQVISGKGTFGIQGTNNGTINQKNLETYDDFVNNGTITLTPDGDDTPGVSDVENQGNGTFRNSDSNITGNGSITVDNGFNDGEIKQSSFTINGTKALDGKTTADGQGIHFVNQGDIIVDNFVNKGNIDTDGYSYGSITTKSGSNSGIINQIKFTVESSNNQSDQFTNSGTIAAGIENKGNFTNDGSIIGEITNSGNFTNNNAIGKQGATNNDLTNSGIFANLGNAYVNNLANSAEFTNSNGGNLVVGGNLENTKEFNNYGELNVAGNIANTGANAVFTNTSNITVAKEFTNTDNALLKNNGNIFINGADGSMANSGSILNEGVIDFSAMNDANKLINSGSITNDGSSSSILGAIVENAGSIVAKNGANLNFVSLDNDHEDGVISLENGSSLNISNQANSLDGLINVEGNGTDPLTGQNRIDINGADFIGTLLVGNDVADKTDLILSNIKITNDAQVGVAQAGKLSLSTGSIVNLNQGDEIRGDIELQQDGTLNLDGYTLTTGNKSTQKGGNEAHYSQLGGTLNLINNSTLKLGDSSAVMGGDLNIDGTSQFLVTSEENGTIDSANFLDNLTIANGGRFGVMNGEGAEYNIENINVNNGTANFTIDVLGRSNAQNEHGTDQFIGTDINGNGTINIEDWTLAGDIFGWQAPIDRDIKLDNVFDYQNISPNVQLSATKKEVFTPIGWYQLNNHGGTTGNYQLNLTRFNPQVYRGQVTTLAQYMNQLAIDDMLFNHSMLLPSFKDDDISDNGAMINRLASANPVYAPYQYSKKDGGLWYRMYGTFETLQMNQAGLGRVGNNAYGTIIGADFGLKDLRNGWKFMPTAYIGYNGAHQYFAGMGAYQNGGQAGFLGTWYKNNFVLGGLIYGGVYQNSMDIAGHVDNTFNYFAGASAKGAYNLRLHRDWVLQPNLMLAYNFFGQQNWHSDFGQMGMMSGTLNGINLAPGLNLIWEKETFSIYATLQYMYNLNGAVDGRAGNVSLPHLYMDRGYIQYGFGFTKRFSDRFAGYFQTVFRNVGRTGVGFQLGLNIKLGK